MLYHRFFYIVTLFAVGLFAIADQSASAQVAGSQLQRRTLTTTSANVARPKKTSTQRVALPRTRWAAHGHIPRVGGMRNGLPPTHLDSFVLNAGIYAELIYGDEAEGRQPPPYECFTEAHRINTGIRGDRNIGLTTGHGSYMPDAWGRDEFSGDPESSQSGARSFIYAPLPYKNRQAKNFEPEQFPYGYTYLDKENYYDEDRLRPSDDVDSGF